MRFRLQYRRYRLPLRTVVRTARWVWVEREGVIVRLETADEGRERPGVGFGEAAPIPEFGTETVDEIEEVLRGLGEWVEEERWATLPARLGCLRNAIASAKADAASEAGGERAANKAAERKAGVSALGVAALLPAGRAVLAQLPLRLEAGFRVLKWKVGVGDVADELALLDDVCAALPGGAKLRLDANGVWDRREAERWLERCAERPVEFVEQPCFAAKAEGASAVAKAEDTLLGLAGDFPTPIALDESLVGEGDVERWLARGWPGVFVVKPSLLGDVVTTLARLEKANAAVVFSSALETAVGARSALRAAFEHAGRTAAPTKAGGETRPGEAGNNVKPPRALGFGVWPLFVDTRFDGPLAAAFVRREDVEQLDPEAVWNALS